MWLIDDREYTVYKKKSNREIHLIITDDVFKNKPTGKKEKIKNLYVYRPVSILNAPPLDGGCSRGYIVNEL
jgi:hypothetical protein